MALLTGGYRVIAAVGMTVGASGSMMIGAASLSTGVGVVERGIPVIRGVAIGTICTELTLVDGRLCMTGGTGCGQAAVISTGVTLCA